MKRRELFQQFLGGLVLQNVRVNDVSVVTADQRPAVVIVEVSTMTVEQMRVIRQGFEGGFNGTVLEGTKVIFLTGDLRLTIFDRAGGVCRQQVDDWLRD